MLLFWINLSCFYRRTPTLSFPSYFHCCLYLMHASSRQLSTKRHAPVNSRVITFLLSSKAACHSTSHHIIVVLLNFKAFFAQPFTAQQHRLTFMMLLLVFSAALPMVQAGLPTAECTTRNCFSQLMEETKS